MATTLVPESIVSLAAGGVLVIPLAAGTKDRPLVKWSKEESQASSDRDQLEIWARQFPNCNWAAITGPRSGFWVLDLDGQEGAAWLSEMESMHDDLPQTRMARSGSGGTHLYYSCLGVAEKIRGSASAIAPHVDVRGDGSIIVLPPSTHPNGNQYTWATSADHPIQPAPDWLVELALAANDKAKDSSIILAGAIPEGERNDTLFRLACSMREKGCSAPAITAALMVENQRCQPPLDEREIQAIAENVASRYQPSVRVVLGDGCENSKLSSQTPPFSLGDIPDPRSLDRQPVRCLVEGIIPMGQVTVFASPAGLGKTWLGLMLARAVKEGRRFMGREVIQVDNVVTLTGKIPWVRSSGAWMWSTASRRRRTSTGDYGSSKSRRCWTARFWMRSPDLAR